MAERHNRNQSTNSNTHKADQSERLVLRRLGEKIQQARQAAGLSQEELAARTGLNRSYLSEVERGVGNASLLVMTKIAEALEVRLSSLMSASEEVDCPKGDCAARILVAVLPTAQDRLSKILKGYDLWFVSELKETHRLLEENGFDLIVAGVQFDDHRLYDLLRITRMSERHRQTPVVVYSALSAGAITPFMEESIDIATRATGAVEFVELRKYKQYPNQDAMVRAAFERWIPADKRAPWVVKP